MKNILIPFCFVVINVQAQPTILLEHLPQVGDVQIAKFDDGDPVILPTPGGSEPQFWDHSEGWDGSWQLATEFLSPVGMPGADLFPNATQVVVETNQGVQSAHFASIGADGWRQEGSIYP